MMQTIILSAGFATRLYPLTLGVPKQLLDIAGRPMINYLLDSVEDLHRFTGQGYPVNMVVNERFASQFIDWSKDSSIPVKIFSNGVLSNETRRGAVGDFSFGLSRIFQENHLEDLLVLGGDNMFDFDLEDMYTHFQRYGSTIAVRDLEDKSLLAGKFGVVEHDSNYKIIGFEEKPTIPKTSLAATLVYMISRNDIVKLRDTYLNKDGLSDNAGEMIRWLSFNGGVSAYSFSGKWVDIGSREDLDIVREEFNRRASRV